MTAMGSDIANYIQEHVKAATMLYELEGAIDETGRLIAHCCASGAKLLLCGNGGSAADAQHIAAELVGRFVAERKALPAIALTTDTSTLTAISNDYGFEKVFERQVNALAAAGDVVVGISTSGNSGNVIEAVKAAKANGCVTIGLLGGGGGQLAGMVDHPIVVPHQTTSYIQECHILIGHIWCAMVDADQTRDDR